MKNNIKIPKGYRELKPGEVIKPNDMLWLWNQGPWTRQGDTDAPSVGQFYRPEGSGHHEGKGTHWTNIRKIRRLPARRGKGRK